MTLRFTEFADFVLARLYELDDGEFHDVKELAIELRETVPDSWSYDVVKMLDADGLVEEAMTFGKPDAMINGAGRIFVEEQQRLRSSTIHDYRAHPGHFVIVAGSGNQVVVGSENVSQATSTEDE